MAGKYTWQTTLKDMKYQVWRHHVEHHTDTPEYKSFLKWMLPAVLIFLFVPMLVFPFMIAFDWPGIVKLILVAVWILYPGIAFPCALVRRRRIQRMALSIPMGEEQVEVVHLKTPEELDFIYDTNGIIYRLLQEPDAEFCNILYNWYHNMGVLKDGKLILYVADTAMFGEKFQIEVPNIKLTPKVAGVFCKDLDVESEEEFARKAKFGINILCLSVEDIRR